MSCDNSSRISEKELSDKGVIFSVFTGAAGALSKAGHHLRFDVQKYTVEYSACDPPPAEASEGNNDPHTNTNTKKTSRSSLGWFRSSQRPTADTSSSSTHSHSSQNDCSYSVRRVTCESEGLSVSSRVDKETNEELGPLSKGDKTAIDKRTLGRYVLEAHKYPLIEFVPHSQAYLHSSSNTMKNNEDDNSTQKVEDYLTIEVTRASTTTEKGCEQEHKSVPTQTTTSFLRFPKTFSGDLTLKGVTRPIDCFAERGYGVKCSNILLSSKEKEMSASNPRSTSDVDGAGGECVTVKCPILQSDFGLTPFSLLGGALAVRDMVEVHVSIPAKMRL